MNSQAVQGSVANSWANLNSPTSRRTWWLRRGSWGFLWFVSWKNGVGSVFWGWKNPTYILEKGVFKWFPAREHVCILRDSLKKTARFRAIFFRSNSWGSNLISPSKHHQPEIIGQVCDSFDWFVLETILSAGFTSWYPPLLDYGCSTMFFGKLRKHVPHICVTYTIYSNLTTILVTINGFNAISPPVQFIFWFAHENNNGQKCWFDFTSRSW